jgi:hypothetical protein
MNKFDYKPLTRDEMWRAKEIELLEAILKALSTNQETTITALEPKPEVKKKAPSKKKEVK